MDGETLTDPLPGLQKTLRIRYLFRGRAHTDSFGDLADVRIGNPGAVAADTKLGDLKIIHAEYGAGTRWADVTAVLERQRIGNTLLVVINNATMAIDPTPTSAKTLRLEYSQASLHHSLSIAENSQLSLPAGSPQPKPAGLVILYAFYGARGRRNNVEGPLIQAIRADRLNLLVNSANMGGDPFPAQSKELLVRYLWQGREFENLTHDDSLVSLPNSNDRLVSGK